MIETSRISANQLESDKSSHIFQSIIERADTGWFENIEAPAALSSIQETFGAEYMILSSPLPHLKDHFSFQIFWAKLYGEPEKNARKQLDQIAAKMKQTGN